MFECGNICKLFVFNIFQVIFEAVKGDNYQGDISIDDVSFTPYCKYGNPLPTVPPTSPHPTTPGPCGAGKFQCKKSQTCILRSKVCDYWKDCPDGSDEVKCGKLKRVIYKAV